MLELRGGQGGTIEAHMLQTDKVRALTCIMRRRRTVSKG